MTTDEQPPEPGAESDPETGTEPDLDGGAADDYVWRDWTREDLKRSAVGGVAAYLATYALLYLWFLSEGRTASDFVDWQWVGRMLYHGQFVPLDVSTGGASGGAIPSAETGLGDASNVVPARILSVAVALAAGFLLARARDPVDADTAIETGASLAVGYLPMAVLGVFVFAGTQPNGIHVSPNPVWGSIVTGLVFPAVVGAFGGLAFVAWRQRTGEDDEEPVEDEGAQPDEPRDEATGPRS